MHEPNKKNSHRCHLHLYPLAENQTTKGNDTEEYKNIYLRGEEYRLIIEGLNSVDKTQVYFDYIRERIGYNNSDSLNIATRDIACS